MPTGKIAELFQAVVKAGPPDQQLSNIKELKNLARDPDFAQYWTRFYD